MKLLWVVGRTLRIVTRVERTLTKGRDPLKKGLISGVTHKSLLCSTLTRPYLLSARDLPIKPCFCGDGSQTQSSKNTVKNFNSKLEQKVVERTEELAAEKIVH